MYQVAWIEPEHLKAQCNSNNEAHATLIGSELPKTPGDDIRVSDSSYQFWSPHDENIVRTHFVPPERRVCRNTIDQEFQTTKCSLNSVYTPSKVRRLYGSPIKVENLKVLCLSIYTLKELQIVDWYMKMK